MAHAVFAVVATMPVVLGLLVLRAHASRAIGGLLIAHGACSALALAAPQAASTGHAGLVVDQLTQGTWVLLFIFLALIGYLLPDGRAGSARRRRWILAGVVGVVLFLIGAAGDANAFRNAHGDIDPPVPWLPAGVSGALGAVGLLVTMALVFGSVAAVRTRLRESDREGRIRLLWAVWGALSAPIALVLLWANHFVLGDRAWLTSSVLALACVALPTTIAVAVLRYRLLDIELLLSRSLTYASLTLLAIGGYALILFGAQALFGAVTAGGWAAVVAVAVCFHPVHAFLRRRIERWVYGYRSDPAVAMRRLADSVDASSPLRVAESVTMSIADALKVTHVRIETVPGKSDPEEIRVPLEYGGEWIGELVVDLPSGRDLSPSDVTLLRDLARVTAVTVHASRLAGDLQTSRSRIVTAREEERRRLRRDLHDGLGPALAAMVLKLNAVESRAEATERRALLTEIREEVKVAINEVRRLVDDLRPAAIDEVGVPGAIRQRAAALTTDAMQFEVIGPDRLPPLPAAVEVAAFRIASESMTNVARHSGASRCTVEITLDGTLELVVTDDGRGATSPAAMGIGWTSMVERATELGGACTMSTRADGGLVVRAVLPIVEAAHEEALS